MNNEISQTVHLFIDERQALCPLSWLCSGQPPWNNVRRSSSESRSIHQLQGESHGSLNFGSVALCVDQCWFGIWLNEWYPYSTSTNGVKEHTRGHQGCNTNQILVLGGNLTTRESLYARVSIGVGITLNHIGTRVILSRYEGSCMLYRPKWYPKKKQPFIYPYHAGIKNCEILIIDTPMVPKEDDIGPTLAS